MIMISLDSLNILGNKRYETKNIRVFAHMPVSIYEWMFVYIFGRGRRNNDISNICVVGHTILFFSMKQTSIILYLIMEKVSLFALLFSKCWFESVSNRYFRAVHFKCIYEYVNCNGNRMNEWMKKRQQQQQRNYTESEEKSREEMLKVPPCNQTCFTHFYKYASRRMYRFVCVLTYARNSGYKIQWIWSRALKLYCRFDFSLQRT